MRSPSTSDSVWIEGGKRVVREVIDEPVKEAVHEAYAEERAAADGDPVERVGGADAPDDGSGNGGGRRLRRLVIPIAGIAGVAYLRRRRRKQSGEGKSDRGMDATPGHDETDAGSYDETDDSRADTTSTDQYGSST